MKNLLILGVFIFSSIYLQSQPQITVSRISEKDFRIILDLFIVDTIFLDLENSYLSFVFNNPDSIDLGSYTILKLSKDEDSKYVADFYHDIENFPRYLRIQLVFREYENKEKYFTESYTTKVVFDDEFRIFYVTGQINFYIIYFNDNLCRDIYLRDVNGRLIYIFKNLCSGSTLELSELPAGIYFLSSERKTRKFLAR